MNQPTQAILQKYGISPIPNPPQAVSGNTQVKNINSNTVNNQVDNKIIVVQPQVPVTQPEVQVKDTQGENLRNWISNQFKAQQQKFQEASDFLKRYGERITEGVQKVTKTVTRATERFAENMNPQKLSKSMVDSKKVLIMMALAILATKFIGPLSRRLDKFYNWFTGDVGKGIKGFVERIKDAFSLGDDNKGFLGTFRDGIKHGLSLLKGYLKLAVDDRVRALSELKNQDLENTSLFSITDIPALIAKTFAALIGGSKALSYIKIKSAGRKLKKKIIEEVWQSKSSDIKNNFDKFGNVKSEFDSVQRVQKKIEELIQRAFKDHYKLWISTPHVLSLLEALKNATFTCYQTDGKLVRGTVISNAKNFLTLLGYHDNEIKQLFEQNHIVDVKSIVIDKNKTKEISGCQVIIEKGWKVLAFFFGAEDVSVSDKKYYETFEQRLLERWKAYWRENLKGNEKALSHLESVNKTSDAWNTYDKELKELKRAWDFAQEQEEARAADQVAFEDENREALDFFNNLKEGVFGKEEDLADIDAFNEKNYSESSGTFNTGAAAREIHDLSYKRFDKHSNFIGDKSPKESTRHCAKHVRMAIEKGGVSLAGNPEFAYQYMSFLPKKGFKLIHSGKKSDLSNPNIYPWPDDLKQGDIAVFNKTRLHPSGHIALYDGRTWYADYRQDTWHGLRDLGFNEFGIFRFDNQQQQDQPVRDEEEKSDPQQSKTTDVNEKMEQTFSLYNPKQSQTSSVTPTSVESNNSATAIEEKDLGTTNKTSDNPEPTNNDQPQTNITSNNPSEVSTVENTNDSDNKQLTDAEKRDAVVSAVTRRGGSVRQVVLHHTMRASYVNGIKK